MPGIPSADLLKFLRKASRNTGSTLVGYMSPLRGARGQTVRDVLDERVSVKTFGAVGDGRTDDTAAIQAALHSSLTGQAVYVPSGVYLITSLEIPRGVMLKGDSSMGTPHNDVIFYGTRFIIKQTTLPAIVMKTGSCIRGFGFVYPDQPILDANPTFIAYNFTIDSSGGSFTRIDECWCSGAYDFIKLRQGCTVTNVGGYPARHCIHINDSGDVVRISNAHFSPNYLTPQPNVGYYNKAAQTLGGAVLKIIYADGVQATNIFGFAKHYGVVTGITPTDAAQADNRPSLQLTNFLFDQVKQGFNFGGNPGNFGIHVAHGDVVPNIGPTNADRSGIHFRGLADDSSGMYVFEDVNFFGIGLGAGMPDTGPAPKYITGDTAGTNAPALNTLIMRNCIFRHYTDAVFYDFSDWVNCRYRIEGYHVPSSVTTDPARYNQTEPIFLTNQPAYEELVIGDATVLPGNATNQTTLVTLAKDIALGSAVDTFTITTVASATEAGGSYMATVEGVVESFTGNRSATRYSSRAFSYVFNVSTAYNGGSASRSAVKEDYLSLSQDSVGAESTISATVCTAVAGANARVTKVQFNVTTGGTNQPSSVRVTANIRVTHSTFGDRPTIALA